MKEKNQQPRSAFKKPVFEFHIERNLRSKYQIEESFFSQQGNVIFTDFSAVRMFVHKLNAKRDPRLHVYPGEVNATGMLEEIFHYILRQYEEQVSPSVMTRAYKHVLKTLGQEKLHALLYDLVDKYPPTPVYNGSVSVKKYLDGQGVDRSNKVLVLEEAIMIFFANFNPANKKLKELFDDKNLADPHGFRLMIDQLEDFFEEQPPFGPNNEDVFNLFKTPILMSPDDISRQLDYIMEKWAKLLPENIRVQLLRSKDLLKEDVRFDTMGGGGGAPTLAPKYKGIDDDAGMFSLGKSGYRYAEDSVKDYEEIEAFTPDVHWMPSVVMIAKNSYVWLDQLSKKYQREIRRLDQIPDEELDLLRKWNFTGLWLIGLWERSEASRRIKHIMGNVDAVSSAYSLYDYQIAHDLGGDEAYHNLNERAKARGLRLASDMVPNHTGLFSKWTIENPDYFIQASNPPFPGYTFTGENLSQHPDIEIRLEDGYFSKTDAAVVFQWANKSNGQVRYMYHGNDGTNMPWNDTAQLDMLKHEVRQAVIDKIFEVARKFSIIRFDAAMTLAKKHFSRLWYPRPGTGGDIPSRADYAMSQRQFDEMFPVEFWREVVDRMNAEMPETLLLAEAFWFMEGYFVRTLGMHRVYNSAFMHMLKNEENEKYRDLITNTLEFEPEILKRYVNFMSNPDEETAIRQFGTDDKYFGVCVLMNTLPGLPMFAHGQIEGYTEKYGMEYQRAYYNEVPQQWLVEKHEKQIFPLTRKRYLFCEVDNFNIFDYVDGYGNVNENVFAFTNRFRNEKALVLYNNKYEQTGGRIHFSAPKLTRVGSGKEPLSISLCQALDLKGDDRVFYVFREHFSGLEFIKRGQDICHDGLQWNLNGFEYKLFWEFREVYDEHGEYENLFWKIGGGVPSVEKALDEMRLQPLHQSFEAIFAEDIINFLVNRATDKSRTTSEKLGDKLLKGRFEEFLVKTARHFNLENLAIEERTVAFCNRVKSIENAFAFLAEENIGRRDFLLRYGFTSLDELLTIGSKAVYRENMIVLLGVFALRSLYENMPEQERSELDSRLLLQWPLRNVLQRTGRGEGSVTRDISLITILIQEHNDLFDFSALRSGEGSAEELASRRKMVMTEKARDAAAMLTFDVVQSFIGVNDHRGVVYFSKESYEELIDWLFTVAILDYFTSENEKITLAERKSLEVLMRENVSFLFRAREISEKSGYELQKLELLLEGK
ncbi:MAG: alpha-amylase [Bacteroidetes bacterium]|nr:MAG: alpha-amylase [Bacteroidota bacterium]